MVANLLSIPTEKQILSFLRRLRCGKNLCCVRCRFRTVARSGKRIWCGRCRRAFTLTTGTVFDGTKLSLRTLWALLWCWTQSIPIRQAEALCHLSEEAVRRWYGTFRAHLPVEEPLLSGTVQMDEAYFRGVALLMAKEIGSRKLAYRLLTTSPGKEQACRFLFECVRPGSRLHTDGSRIYHGSHRRWPVRHATDIHAKWEFGKTSEIEGTFGNLRTFLRRTYHHATPASLPELVGEFTARYSHPEWFTSPHAYLTVAVSPASFD